MTKKSFLLFFAFISLMGGYFTFAGFQFDASYDNKASGLKAGSHKIQGYSIKSSMQDLNTNAAPSNLTRGNQGLMTANEAIITGGMVELLNKLLASNDLNEFAGTQIQEIESFCQNHKHPLSELSCQVLQHQLYLVKKQDDLSNSLESDWVAVDHDGGGIALEENTEITALSSDEQITGESGRLGEDVESSLENLADRALFDHSAKVRNQALQEAILMKSEAMEALFQDALKDEYLPNRKLAAEGLRQLRERSMIATEPPMMQMQQAEPANLAHTSLSDQPTTVAQ